MGDNREMSRASFERHLGHHSTRTWCVSCHFGCHHSQFLGAICLAVRWRLEWRDALFWHDNLAGHYLSQRRLLRWRLISPETSRNTLAKHFSFFIAHKWRLLCDIGRHLCAIYTHTKVKCLAQVSCQSVCDITLAEMTSCIITLAEMPSDIARHFGKTLSQESLLWQETIWAKETTCDMARHFCESLLQDTFTLARQRFSQRLLAEMAPECAAVCRTRFQPKTLA